MTFQKIFDRVWSILAKSDLVPYMLGDHLALVLPYSLDRERLMKNLYTIYGPSVYMWYPIPVTEDQSLGRIACNDLGPRGVFLRGAYSLPMLHGEKCEGWGAGCTPARPLPARKPGTGRPEGQNGG